MTNHVLAAVAVVMTLVSGVRADHEKDAARIKQLWTELDRCDNEKDGDKAVTLVSKATFKNNERILKLALSATKEQLKSEGPTARMEVLRIRMSCTREQVEKFNGRGYHRWATAQGWYATPADERTEATLDDFKFNGKGTRGDRARGR